MEFMKNTPCGMVDVVHDFGSSLQRDVGRGFLHISNVLLFFSTCASFLWDSELTKIMKNKHAVSSIWWTGMYLVYVC